MRQHYKVSIELPVTTGQCCDMSERYLKSMINSSNMHTLWISNIYILIHTLISVVYPCSLGQWSVEEPKEAGLEGDLALIMKVIASLDQLFKAALD